MTDPARRSPNPPSPARLELSSAPGAITSRQLNWLSTQLHAAVAHLGQPGEVRVRIVGDAEMSAAHHRHLSDPTTTDVLTFDLTGGQSASGQPLDVDILICSDEAVRQAASRNHPPEHELLLYAVHGILHCLGHDDHDDDAYQKMHHAEDAILNAIGVGPIFQTTPTPIASAPAASPR